MRTFPDFQDELLKLDPRLSLVPNPNRPQLANIKLDGVDVCPVPAYEIREDSDPTYTIELPNGARVPHKSRIEALAYVNHMLKVLENKDNADAFFGRNGY